MLSVPDATNYSATETLRNGQRIDIRALRPDDRDDFIAAVSRTSSQSLYRRFFSVRRHFTETETAFYLNVDFVNHVALVALVEENSRPTIIGGGRYVVVQPGQAEIGFTVLDKYQGQGVGAALLRHLAAIARNAGTPRVDRTCTPGQSRNVKSIREKRIEILRKTGFRGRPRHAGTILTFETVTGANNATVAKPLTEGAVDACPI